MQLQCWRYDLKLAHQWTIATNLKDGGTGRQSEPVVFLRLTDGPDRLGLGEAAPSLRYGEDIESTLAFLKNVDPRRLAFDDPEASMNYLREIQPSHQAALTALNLALLDGAGRLLNQPVYDLLGLGFTEQKHLTSFSIGIDSPESIRRKVSEAESYPILKLKLGSADDAQNLQALREAAPDKTLRVDANEAWSDPGEALKKLEWLAADGNIQWVEQPMPAASDPKQMAWLKERSPLPLMADESCISARDIPLCTDCFHMVNVKLVKAGGISGAYDALRAARQAGLKTMIGCMIESSLLITAGAHLAELADALDLDGNLLITNDPYRGVTAHQGILSFAQAQEETGLRVREKATTTK